MTQMTLMTQIPVNPGTLIDSEDSAGNICRKSLDVCPDTSHCGGGLNFYFLGKNMASLYKKPILVTDTKTGKRVKGKSRKWWGRYRDENGVERRVPLAIDKAAAQAMLNEHVRKAERKSAGLEDPFEKHRKRPLSEHLNDYKNYLADKGSTPDHVALTTQRIQAVIDDCGFESIDHISASRVQSFLGLLRGKGRSITTSNHYLRAIKMFVRWLVRDRRTNDDRLAYLSKMNADTDRRHVRRPLSMDEFSRLLKAAERGPILQDIAGPDRAMLYIVAAYTGYRRNEIGSVQPASFDFASDPPTMTVEAGYSKRRRHDVVPLRSDFAKRIQTWMANKAGIQPNMSLFDVTDKRTSAMIKRDLESAGIPRVDERGRVVDFHSLRMTFITNLSRAGVSPKTAQTFARHSDINLTMNTYTTIGVLDQASAVESLPPIPLASVEQDAMSFRATGTDGSPGSESRHQTVPTVVPRGAENGAAQSASQPLRIASNCTGNGLRSEPAAGPGKAKNSQKNVRLGDSQVQPASLCTELPKVGLEPTLTCVNRILSPARLPFRHFGSKSA